MTYHKFWMTCLMWVGLIVGCQFLVGNVILAKETSVQEETTHRYTFSKGLMGVPFQITLYAKDEDTANKAIKSAYKRVNELNAILSDYDPKSELMLLCKASQKGKPIKVSDDLLTVLMAAQELSKKTDGAFDVTVGPMVKAWRRTRRSRQFPSKRKIERLQQQVGWRFMVINKQQKTVELQKEGMLLDLGGIAKGYAADEILLLLKKQGISSVLVNAGGDIVVGDAPPGKEGWKIGIAALQKPNAPPTQFVLLKNSAIATSGDAYQYVELRGKRYSHIVNPHTGLGLTSRSSVSVIAPTGMQSDSLASAISVLGAEAGLKLIQTDPNTHSLFVSFEDNKTQTVISKGFKVIQE